MQRGRRTERSATGRWSVRCVVGVAVVAACVGTMASPAFAAKYAYGCHSAVGSSATEYFVVGDAPDEVVQGTQFKLERVVLTGTVPQDLYIDQLSFSLHDPANATPDDGLTRSWGHDGMPPLTPDGSTNSTTEMTF